MPALKYLIGTYILLAVGFSGFIVYFDRRKFATVSMGFFYILAFFLAGALMLAVSTVALFTK